MPKKVKEQVPVMEKVKDEIQVVESEIHLLIYQVSENEERVLSSYNHKEDILFLINEFSKSQILREKHDIENPKNLKMISTSCEYDFGISLPSVEIRKQEIENLFAELEKSTSEMEEPKVVKIN